MSIFLTLFLSYLKIMLLRVFTTSMHKCYENVQRAQWVAYSLGPGKRGLVLTILAKSFWALKKTPPTIFIRTKAACLEILAIPKCVMPLKLYFKTNASRRQFSPWSCGGIIQHLTQRLLLILLSPQGPHSRLLNGVCFHRFHFSGRKLSMCERGYLVQLHCKNHSKHKCSEFRGSLKGNFK